MTLSVAGCDLGRFEGVISSADGDGGVDLGPDAGPGGPADASGPLGCNSTCHGDRDNPAPPVDLSGGTSTDRRGVGAHRSHLNPSPTWHRAVACGDCHQVPAIVGAPGHMDDGDDRAEITFSDRARASSASPRYDGTTCSGVYCHGATLSGGSLTTPSWTVVDGSQKACGTCHGFPPPAPHVSSTDCGACHPTVRKGSTEFLDPDSHINGTLDVIAGLACDACHGSGGEPAPPKDLDGNTARTARGVGAHRLHLGTSDWHRPVFCSNCHVVPTAQGAPGHIDGDNRAELTFDALNPSATYDVGAGRCDNLYCHGTGRSSNGSMVWTDDPTLSCTSCHAMAGGGSAGLQGRHGKHIWHGVSCSECHAAVVDGSNNILAPDLHIDGSREVKIRRGGSWNGSTGRCSNLACHGSERW